MSFFRGVAASAAAAAAAAVATGIAILIWRKSRHDADGGHGGGHDDGHDDGDGHAAGDVPIAKVAQQVRDRNAICQHLGRLGFGIVSDGVSDGDVNVNDVNVFISHIPDNMSAQCCVAYAALNAFKERTTLPRGLRPLDLVPVHDGNHYNLLAFLHCPVIFAWVIDQCCARVRAVQGTALVAFDKTLAFATPVAMKLGLRVACARIVDTHTSGFNIQSRQIAGDGSSYHNGAVIALDASALLPTDTVVLLHDVVSTGATKNALEALLTQVHGGGGDWVGTPRTVHSIALIDCCSHPGAVQGLLAGCVE
jgi:adenine/guanine phosphoribosyltransferase-like PRPP-binding protein